MDMKKYRSTSHTEPKCFLSLQKLWVASIFLLSVLIFIYQIYKEEAGSLYHGDRLSAHGAALREDGHQVIDFYWVPDDIIGISLAQSCIKWHFVNGWQTRQYPPALLESFTPESLPGSLDKSASFINRFFTQLEKGREPFNLTVINCNHLGKCSNVKRRGSLLVLYLMACVGSGSFRDIIFIGPHPWWQMVRDDQAKGWSMFTEDSVALKCRFIAWQSGSSPGNTEEGVCQLLKIPLCFSLWKNI